MSKNTQHPTEPPKSNLSAEAKEWYPPNYNPQPVAYMVEQPPQHRHQQRFSVQDRLRQAQDQSNPYNFDQMSYSLGEAENMDMRVGGTWHNPMWVL